MIRRLPHLVRGLLAALAVWFVASCLLGFGMGIAEVALLGAVSVAVLLVVGGAWQSHSAANRARQAVASSTHVGAAEAE